MGYGGQIGCVNVRVALQMRSLFLGNVIMDAAEFDPTDDEWAHIIEDANGRLELGFLRGVGYVWR